MKRSKVNSMFVGHRLLSVAGRELSKATGKEVNVWRNHGLFGSRTLAALFAKDRLPGKKIHIEGVRVDLTPVEFVRKENSKEA